MAAALSSSELSTTASFTVGEEGSSTSVAATWGVRSGNDVTMAADVSADVIGARSGAAVLSALNSGAASLMSLQVADPPVCATGVGESPLSVALLIAFAACHNRYHQPGSRLHSAACRALFLPLLCILQCP